MCSTNLLVSIRTIRLHHVDKAISSIDIPPNFTETRVGSDPSRNTFIARKKYKKIVDDEIFHDRGISQFHMNIMED